MANGQQNITVWCLYHWICFFSLKCVCVCDCGFVCLRTVCDTLTAALYHDFCSPMPNYLPKYSSTPRSHHIFWGNTDQNTHSACACLDCHSESVSSSVSSRSTGKERERCKQWKHLERNLRISRPAISFWPLEHKGSLKGNTFLFCFWP